MKKPSLYADIEQGVLEELEDSVQQVLESVFTNVEGRVRLEPARRLDLQDLFALLLTGATAAAHRGADLDGALLGEVDAFCRALLQTPQLRSEAEELATLLISYGVAKLEEAGESGL